jgi:hypothetical protein
MFAFLSVPVAAVVLVAGPVIGARKRRRRPWRRTRARATVGFSWTSVDGVLAATRRLERMSVHA